MFLEVRDLRKAFHGDRVLDGVTLSVRPHETLGILGRSGCGKTTLLKIIAGLYEADSGSVILGDRDITALPPQQRGVMYLYQEPLLFPHLSVFENMAFGLRLRKADPVRIRGSVAHMIESLELSGHGEKMPHQLSGGQKQRVSFGRALMVNPSLLLLDEPFSSLDAESRAAMQGLFKRVAAEYSITALFVTHSLKEAILMGDSIATIRDGALRTYGSKQEFLASPTSGVAEEIAFWEGLKETLHEESI